MNEIPDATDHTGDWGKEPIIALIGSDAVDVAKMAVCLAQLYSIRKPEVLFAPTRSLYTDEKQSTSCIFCGISTEEPEIEEMILYKDEDNMVIINIYPYNRGHLEVVPGNITMT